MMPGLGALVLAAAAAAAGGAESGAYEVVRTKASAAALLDAGADAWRQAAPITWGPAGYETTFRALWNGEGLAVTWEAVDPEPWHTLTERDAHLWDEEVVEIFLDPDRSGTHYAEVEVSPANVVCDLHILRPLPDWKGEIAWDWAGLTSRVETRRQAETTVGWTASAVFPWKGLSSLPSAKRVALPPKAGDRWRFNVFRIERPHGPKDPAQTPIFAAWSPAHIPLFHVATAFRDLVFK
jgi:hypothetical protein